MLSDLKDNWNNLFFKDDVHDAKIVTGNVTIHEEQLTNTNGFTDLTFSVTEAIDFSSRTFDSFNHWNSLTNQNCDGAYLINNNDGSYDLVLFELKSNFATEKIFEAKTQIVISLIKLRILLKSTSKFSQFKLRRTYGIIVSKEPDVNQLAFLNRLDTSDKKNLGNDYCGFMLWKYQYLQAETRANEFSNDIIDNKIDIYYYPSKGTTANIDLDEVAPL